MRFSAFVLAVLALAGCERDPVSPAQQAATALEAARGGIERARASIQATERQSEALQDRIRAQRTALNDLVERRLMLLAQQLEEDKQRIRRLPAPKETELQPRIAELQKLVQETKARLLAYRDAPPEKSTETLAALEQSLATLGERRHDLEAQLDAS